MRYVYVERPKPADFFRASEIKIRAEHLAMHDACHIHGIVGPFGGSASLQFGDLISDAGTHHDAATRHQHAEIPADDRVQPHQQRKVNGTLNDDNMSFGNTIPLCREAEVQYSPLSTRAGDGLPMVFIVLEDLNVSSC